MFHWPVDFKQLQRPASPNLALLCTPGTCSAGVDIDAQRFPVSVQRLESAWQAVIAKEPRFKLLKSQGYQQLYVQRSLVWRFPDYIAVEFVPMGTGHSGIAMVSQSKYGHYDFGVNLARLKRLYQRLCDQLKPASAAVSSPPAAS